MGNASCFLQLFACFSCCSSLSAVPGWGTHLWAVISHAVLPAPSHAGQALSRPAGLSPSALTQRRRADHAELGPVCCKATPAASRAQPVPFSVGNWINFHVIECTILHPGWNKDEVNVSANILGKSK